MKTAVRKSRFIPSRLQTALSTQSGKLCFAVIVTTLFSAGVMAVPLLAAFNIQAYYQGLLMIIAPLTTLSFCISLFSLYLTVMLMRSRHQVAQNPVPLGKDTPAVKDAESLPESNPEEAFHQTVLAAARSYGLTKRETEVFELLLQGRNAERISKSLVISKHTSKSHIYHIYRKTDTSSQQDLLDLFECEFQDTVKG